MSFKDLVSITLSLLAFIISAGSAYFNIVRQIDDVRVTVGDGPYLFLDDRGRTALFGDQQITVINSGNRSAAITDVTLVVSKGSEKLESVSECTKPETISMYYATDGFVIKPGEITVQKFLQPAFPQEWESGGARSRFMGSGSSTLMTLLYRACGYQ
jgi:hypothetical protein